VAVLAQARAPGLRPGELRAAEWPEFDLENAEWRIPGKQMKMGEPHLVPLSRQPRARRGVSSHRFARGLPERRKMMQACADYLDRLRAGADVVALPRRV